MPHLGDDALSRTGLVELWSLAMDSSQTPRTTAVVEIPGVSRLELRRQCVFASASRQGAFLEIGPAHNAILPKRDGFPTRTVDYLDREGLIERYKQHPNYSADDIEDVDYVLPPGAAMADIIPDRFDLVLASHVLEHTTSMIDFLNECARLLAPGGVLALIVPDHRYCFDRFRERAALGRVIDASLAPPALHTMGTLIEERLNAAKHRGTTAWAPHHTGTYELVHTRDTALRVGHAAQKGDRYIDAHNWICTPHHLRLLLQDLHELGFTPLRETYFHDTVRHEFFINLSLDGAGTGLTRAELLVLSENERISLDPPVFG
jgi:SAM-dependent methyltransferase